MKLAEPIRDGLKAIAAEIKNSRESRDRDRLEGYLTDEEKIRMLKLDLYRTARCRFYTDSDVKHMEQLRRTISLISNEVERKNGRKNSLTTTLNEGARTFFGLGMLVVAASYAVQWSGTCNHVNSVFCRNARAIPTAIERYFYNEPSLVNPEPSANIDQPQSKTDVKDCKEVNRGCGRRQISFTPPPNNPRPRCLNRSCAGGGSLHASNQSAV